MKKTTKKRFCFRYSPSWASQKFVWGDSFPPQRRNRSQKIHDDDRPVVVRILFFLFIASDQTPWRGRSIFGRSSKGVLRDGNSILNTFYLSFPIPVGRFIETAPNWFYSSPQCARTHTQTRPHRMVPRTFSHCIRPPCSFIPTNRRGSVPAPLQILLSSFLKGRLYIYSQLPSAG